MPSYLSYGNVNINFDIDVNQYRKTKNDRLLEVERHTYKGFTQKSLCNGRM